MLLLALAAVAVCAQEEQMPCPDHSTCAEDATCCQNTTGSYSCCPYAHGVCCSDRRHCCKFGYVCDSRGFCRHQSHDPKQPDHMPLMPYRPSKHDADPDPKPEQCVDGAECAANETCCRLASGRDACCLWKDAVCCPDQKHCCPNGFTCNEKAGRCEKPKGSAWLAGMFADFVDPALLHQAY